MNVGDIIRRTATDYPDRVGIVFQGATFTWEQVNRRINRLAHGLLKLGLARGDRVAILSQSCHQYIEFYFAVAKAGLVGVPLNSMLLPAELEFIINDAGARALVVDAHFSGRAREINAETVRYFIGLGAGHGCPLDLETLMLDSPEDEPTVTVTADAIFTLAYTSGTTAFPKGAMISHLNGITGITTMAHEWHFQPESVYLLHAPMYFAAGGGPRLHAVSGGSRCVIINYDVETVLRTIERQRVTHFSMSPTPIQRILDHPGVEDYDLSSVRMIGLSGAPHPAAEIRRVEALFGHVWYSTYGMTETNVCGTCLPPAEVAVSGPLSRRIASVGRPVRGMAVMVVDADGAEVPHDGSTMGEVILRGDAVSRGYWHQPEHTAGTIRDGWFYSGDLATVDEDGYLYIAGRRKEVIISGGVNIAAREIEEVITAHPAVSQCAVIGVPDADWGERPMAIVVLKAGSRATEADILDLCRQKLASFKKPKAVEFTAALPLTPTGKVLKRKLIEMYGGIFQSPPEKQRGPSG